MPTPRPSGPTALPEHALDMPMQLHTILHSAHNNRHSLSSLLLQTQSQPKHVARCAASVPNHHTCIRVRTCARFTPPQHTAHCCTGSPSQTTSHTSTAPHDPSHGPGWPLPVPSRCLACACAAENRPQQRDTLLYSIKVLNLLQNRHFDYFVTRWSPEFVMIKTDMFRHLLLSFTLRKRR